ncbi:MAG: enoyl-CoA hydratase-related protein [Thermoplasmata archaeon]|nr:enoyl-CoA hydratase-related protein [Thermoplasmata archaeon]MCI4338526.1 enoyl-CoA hydratase-related protein [Thermoplasmata archaeon]MCI4341191.1 enoyl-CoA hydratase-related protein [Thermoplasmata archaeon]
MPTTIERQGSVALIRICRAARLNALDVPEFRQLREALESVRLDSSVRAAILTGEGRAFCAGGDVAAMQEASERGTLPQFFHELTGEQERSVRAILLMPKPVVAVLPGVAAGGGLSLALSADWRIATEEALLVPAFPALGAVPDGGLTYFLPHFLGVGLAQELLFTNARIAGPRARELGLVHELVAPDRLEARGWERARELAEGPTFAYGWMKRLMVAAFSGSLESQLALEREGAVEAADRSDLAEGILAFREKRRPVFLGR